ncbi:histidine kinase [Parapedobacter sp. 2B3]|uniref:histidine kinase n=1 Tax=Parapedobacter sp. 2B3 TaxID=3342381 RepID=UPI0035B6A439
MNDPSNKRQPWAGYGWLVLLSAGLSWRYVTVTAAPVFSGWGDWLILFVLMALAFCYIFFKLGPKLVNKQVLLNAAMFRWAVGLLVSLLVLLVGISWWLGSLSFGFNDEVRQQPGIENFMEVTSLLVAGIAAGFATFAKKWGTGQYVARRTTEVKLRRLEKKWNTLQQSWVQQDLPPHLLFNSLSVARGLIKKEPEKARRAMTLIGKLANYYVRKCKWPEIPLVDELEQLALSKELYELRFDAELALEIQVPEAADQLTIIPMLLILLLENMAKHGVLTDPDRPAQLTIRSVGKRTEITACNYVKAPLGGVPEGLGIAIANIRKQLNLRYPGKSEVQTAQADGRFTIHICFEQ